VLHYSNETSHSATFNFHIFTSIGLINLEVYKNMRYRGENIVPIFGTSDVSYVYRRQNEIPYILGWLHVFIALNKCARTKPMIRSKPIKLD